MAAFQKAPEIIKGVMSNFDSLRQRVILFGSVMIGIFAGSTILTGIMRMIALFKELKGIIQATGIASAIMEAIATGGASIGVLALTMAAAAGVAAVTYYAINKALDSGSGGLKKVPGMKELLEEQEKIYGQLSGAGHPWLPNSSLGGASGQGGEPDPNSTLGRIAAATEKTAKNTDIQNQILGGGALAREALNRQTIGDLGRASGGRAKTAHGQRAIDEFARLVAVFENGGQNRMTRREV